MTLSLGRAAGLGFLLLLGLLGVTTANAENRPVYFPVGTWPAEDVEVGYTIDQIIFYEEWFGGQLFAMGEPSLSRPSQALSGDHYRLLIVPSFTPATAIHIWEIPEGRPEITATVLNGKGGYEPGTVAIRTRNELTETQLSPLRKRSQDMGLWCGRVPPKKDQICADGTTYVLELAHQNYFHAIQFHQCELTPELVALLLEFTPFLPEETILYGVAN